MIHMHTGNLLEEHTFFAEEVPLPVPLILGVLGLFLAAATLWLVVTPEPMQALAALGFGKDDTSISAPDTVAPPPAPLLAPQRPVAAPVASLAPAPQATIAVPAPPATVAAPPVTTVPPPAADAVPPSPPAQTPVVVVGAPVPSATPSATVPRSNPCAPLFAVGFDLAEAEPQAPELPAKVDRLTAWLHAHPQARLVIEGHTDTSGGEVFNLALSQRRAIAVAQLMVAAGMPADRLITRGFGGERPLDGVPGWSGRNRRVAMRIAGAPECPAPSAEGER